MMFDKNGLNRFHSRMRYMRCFYESGYFDMSLLEKYRTSTPFTKGFHVAVFSFAGVRFGAVLSNQDRTV